MSNIIDIFLEITKIPRCSKQTQKMKENLVNRAKEYGYKVQVDSAKNILVSSKEPKICLQAHYDMVCVGDAPKIEPVIEDNILKAKNSSLGADNGMAIAMMLALMQEGIEAEFLFTNDEEIGLIGAANLELNIKSNYLLNLDSEEEGSVCIGCAGGVDMYLDKELQIIQKEGSFYEISISGLPGGHSGVDIDKEIPNAIVELLKFLEQNGCKIATISGGERINSIPANAKAVVWAPKELQSSDMVSVKSADAMPLVLVEPKEFLGFEHGILEWSSSFNVANSSVNFALIDIDSKGAKISLSYRSLDNAKLETITQNDKAKFEELGFSVELQDKYPAWKPNNNEFTKLVERALTKVYGRSKSYVIHAGLECGLLGDKLPNVKMASIGPNIFYPHSIREYTEIDSVDRVYSVVKEILEQID